ncbi:hypothetical protein IFM89_037791 [Coptis chinensis]|uniref:MADS-box domain-containing protein n=1 Tax=Coptis chinensis TaxID=261450 RepID=A0A835H7R5_9MAGN|nr:hypothetical protein IFM89_037791 [Coptis chinensis]
MAKKKIKLAWIANDAARRATFKKRNKGLMKKVSELSTLCGVEACAIIYGPYDPEPDVWPSSSEAHRVLMRFKSMPEMEQSKKMMNQEGFLGQRIVKVREQLKRQQRENREYEITQLMSQCLMGKGLQDVGREELSDMAWLIDEKMKGLQQNIDVLRRTTMAPQMIPGNERIQNGGGSVEEDKALLESLQRHSWLMEVMNPHHEQQHVYFGDDLVMPYGDTAPWSNRLFS